MRVDELLASKFQTPEAAMADRPFERRITDLPPSHSFDQRKQELKLLGY